MMIILRLIGVLINMFDRAFYHTNDKKDWDDFWYNSDPIYPPETNTNYNQLVDHLVSTMTIHSTKDSKEWTDNIDPPFDTQAYDNYKELINKKRGEIDTSNLTETIMQLGFQLDQQLQRIIDKLDVILEDESVDST